MEPDKSLALDDGLIGMYRFLNPFEISIETKEADIEDIEKTKCLYNILTNLDSNILEKLQISINRWIRSKMSENEADQMIDLGIALETLYLSNNERGVSARLSVRAAWYLGKDKEHRKELLKKFEQIYRCRSNAVHSGKLGKTAKFGDKDILISEFIAEAQDLCWESIMKILEAKRIPNRDYWDSLIVGGENEQPSS